MLVVMAVGGIVSCSILFLSVDMSNRHHSSTSLVHFWNVQSGPKPREAKLS